MNDSPLTNAMNIEITQFSYVYSNAPDDKYIIVAYDIENVGSSNLINLYAGIFADWDIMNANGNQAGYDPSRKMGYVRSLSFDTVYAAVQL